METESTGTERGTERVEAFSDGVMAIAITLLILDVKMPHPQEWYPLIYSMNCSASGHPTLHWSSVSL